MPISASIRRARRASVAAGAAPWRRSVPDRSIAASSIEIGSTAGVTSFEQRADLAADGGVFLHVRADHRGVGAGAERAVHRHRRADAEGARVVARRHHHAPPAAADQHRPAAQRRVVALLDRGVEGVAVDMGDREAGELGVAHHPHRPAGPARRPRRPPGRWRSSRGRALPCGKTGTRRDGGQPGGRNGRARAAAGEAARGWNTIPDMTSAFRRKLAGLATALLAGAGAAVPGAAAGAEPPGPLRLGLLTDLSMGSPEVRRDRRRGFDLAIAHIDRGGGVFGRPVAVAVGDSADRPGKGDGRGAPPRRSRGRARHRRPRHQRRRALGRAGGDRPGGDPHRQQLGELAEAQRGPRTGTSCSGPPIPTSGRVRSSPGSRAGAASTIWGCSTATTPGGGASPAASRPPGRAGW